MPEAHITLYGDTSEWFEETKRRVTEEHRDGHEPSNAEMVRLLLQHADL